MAEYYSGQCKNCKADCDGVFCSESCAEEWEAGYEDYLDGLAEDRRLNDSMEAGERFDP